MSIIDENTKKMVDDNAKKSIEEAETYIVATNKSLTLKGTKPEAMAVVSIMLKRLIEDKIIDFAIGKLAELKIKSVFEDKTRKKTRYIKKTQAYQDLINLLKEMKYYA